MKKIVDVFEGLLDDDYDVAPIDLLAKKYRWVGYTRSADLGNGRLELFSMFSDAFYHRFATAMKEAGYTKFKTHGVSYFDSDDVYEGLDFQGVKIRFRDVREFKNCIFSGYLFEAVPKKGHKIKFNNCEINTRECRIYGSDIGDLKGVKVSDETNRLLLMGIGKKMLDLLENEWGAVHTENGVWKKFYRPRFGDLTKIDPIKKLGLTNFKNVDQVELITVNSANYPYVELTKRKPEPSYRDHSVEGWTEMANGWWLVTRAEAFCR